jgi:uncharacterized membrane protein YfcA
MQTLYFIVFTVLGGLLAVFISAGWSSYTEKKLPELPVLFRWALTGTLTAGLGAYAWLFGAGGDPAAVMEQVSNVLEVKDVVSSLASSIAPEPVAVAVAEPPKTQDKKSPRDITVGMPTF